MDVGNHIRNAHIWGKGWEVHVEINARDDTALADAKACIHNLVVQSDTPDEWTLPKVNSNP